MIPARYKSSRFPGKPLADIHGKPLIWWVYRQAAKVHDFRDIFVATDDERIKSACDELKMRVIMTDQRHKTGTDRVGEVAKRIKAELYVNIQGDEPLLNPETIQRAIDPFYKKTLNAAVTNLMTEIKQDSDLLDPTVPKVVCNAKNEAVFLSRLPIPCSKNSEPVKRYKQVCVYGFTPGALEMFCNTSRGPVESAEDIELLRFIENNVRVQMIEVDRDTIAVDTPSDLEKVKLVLGGIRKTPELTG